MAGEKPLKNAKHEAVLQNWINDPERIGWRAYIKVYPHQTEKTARGGWTKIAKTSKFIERKEYLLTQIMFENSRDLKDKAILNAKETLIEISNIARSSILNCIIDGDDSREVVKALRDMPPEVAATVKELHVETYIEGKGDDARTVKRVRIKLHDKIKALEMLGRFHALFLERVEHTGPDGGPIQIDESFAIFLKALNDLGSKLVKQDDTKTIEGKVNT